MTQKEDWKYLDIPDYVRDIAKIRAEKIWKEARMNNLRGLFQVNDIEDDYKGCLAEEMFDIWLKVNTVPFTRKIVYGKSDSGDFIIRGKVFDAKSGHRKFPIEMINPFVADFCFLIPSQKESDYYVSVVLDRYMTKVGFLGFISYSKIKDRKIISSEKLVHPARQILICELEPIDLLKDPNLIL
jgi:hypothetical protein